jgi:SAM-dependent methyltransferase
MKTIDLPNIRVPDDMPQEEMPDLLRYWYLGSKARHHMMLRRFAEVDVEVPGGLPDAVRGEKGKVEGDGGGKGDGAGEGRVERDGRGKDDGDSDGRGKDGRRHLDIGSAWGYNVLALSKLGLAATGMDLVIDQFGAGKRIARANDLPFNVVGADAARLPFTDGSFASISMVETLEHVFEDDRDRVFAECRRVLTRGGRLILSTPNHGSIVERAKRIVVRFPWLRRRLPTMCYPTDEVTRADYHPYRYHQPWSAAKIGKRLEDNGYNVLKTKYFLFVLKSTSDSAYPILALLEKILERLPLVNRLAATVCVVAEKK